MRDMMEMLIDSVPRSKHYVEITTGAEMQKALLEYGRRQFWLKREHRFSKLLSWPLPSFLKLKLERNYRIAWREIEFIDTVRNYVEKVGSDNVSGMDITILSMDIPNDGPRHQ